MLYLALYGISYSVLAESEESNGLMRNPSTLILVPNTLQSGLTFVHQQGTNQLKGLNETLGSGACAFDYDNDGWVDLYVVNGSGQTRFYGQHHWWQQPKSSTLYRNLGQGKFVDVTKQLGVEQRVWGMGCAAADFDNDGDQDLLTLNIGKNELFRNDGEKGYSNITLDSAIQGEAWSTSASIADYDGDGLLDIYIVNYIDYNRQANIFEQAKGFKEDLSPFFNSSLYDSVANKLYKNLGNMQFQEVAEQAGVQNISGRSLSSLWMDINNDQLPDLYVANDHGLPDIIYINIGNGKFHQSENQYQQNSNKSSRNINAGDIDNDGDLDLFVSTRLGEAPFLLVNGDTPINKVSTFRLQENKLTDLSREMKVGIEATRRYSGWGSGFADFNNDGWLDLFQTNGLITPHADANGITTGQSKLLWLNKAGQSFHQVQDSPQLKTEQSGRGVVFADFDNDGDVDIYATHNNDLGQLLVNESRNNHHWLGVKLAGKSGNKDAIGAKVWLKSEKLNLFTEVGIQQGFLSQSDRRLHFGLGLGYPSVSLEVLWPGGLFQTFDNISVDKYIEIKEGVEGFKVIKFDKVGMNHDRLLVQLSHVENWKYLLSWLNKTYPDQTTLYLRHLIQHEDEEFRRIAIDFMQSNKQAKQLELLLGAVLEEDNIDNLLLMIKAIRQYEDEHSVKWLLNLLNHSSPEVRCATAETFGFFFREEEAVIIRKYLALSPLIALLDDRDATVRVCAANALGDAEKYRGVMPLTGLLNDPDELVRLAAVRSLGLIREKQAESYLLSKLKDPSTSAVVSAQIIIALKRLKYDGLNKELSGVLKETDNNDLRGQIKQLLILRELIDNSSDGVVISQTDIYSIVLNWLNIALLRNDDSLGSKKAISIALDVLEKDHSQETKQLLYSLRNDSDEFIREKAYRYLLKYQRSQFFQKMAQKGLLDNSIRVRKTVIEVLSDESILLPKVNWSFKLQSNIDKHIVIPLLVKIKNKNTIKMLRNWLEKKDSDLQTEVLTALLKQPYHKALPEIDVEQFVDQPRLLALAIRYHFNQLAKFPLLANAPDFVEKSLSMNHDEVTEAVVNSLISRNEAWAKQLVKQLLFDGKQSEVIVKTMLEGLNELKQPHADDLIFAFSKRLHHPLNIHALSRLRPKTDKAEKYLWRLLQSKNINERVRFAAARQLFPENKVKIVDFLLKTKFTDKLNAQ